MAEWPAFDVNLLRQFPTPEHDFQPSDLPAPWPAKLIAAGLLRREASTSERLRVTSKVAYQALQSLAAFAGQLSAPALECLRRLPDRAGWTVDDLFRLESERVAAAQAAGIDPLPLRHQISVLIIVKAHQAEGDQYLLAQRQGWQGFGLIGGKFDPQLDRTPAETAHREVIEELQLASGEFEVKPLPVGPVIVKALSQRLGLLTEYRFDLFQLLADRLPALDKDFAWFDRTSVRAARTDTGEPLNHLAYPEIHRALWEDLPGGLDGLPNGLPALD